MKIENIYAANFKSFSNLTFNPEKTNIIIGKNGSGKTSVLELIKYILTGEAPDSIVKSGETQCVASANVFGYDVLRRYGNKNELKINGKTTTQKSFAQIVNEETGCTMDSLKLATSTNMLSAMNAGQFAEFLMTNKLIPIEIDMDTLLALCPMSQDAELELSMVLPAAPVTFDMDAIDNAYSTFFSARTILKNELKKKQVEAIYEGPQPTRDIAAIDAELLKCSSYDTEMATYNKLNTVYENAVKQRQSILAQIADIEDKIKAMGTVQPCDPQAKSTFTAQLNAKRGQRQSTAETLHTLKVNFELFTRSIAQLRSNTCPFSERLVCTTDKTELITDLEANLSATQSEIDKQSAQLDDIDKKIGIFESKIKEQEDLERLNKDLEVLYSKRNALKANIPEVPEQPTPPAIIADMASKKAALNVERANFIKCKSAETAANEVKHIEKQVKIHDELVQLLSPKAGIRQEVMRVALEPIVEHCNNRAKQLKLDFEVGLKADNGVQIICNPRTGSISEPLTLECVSSGEQAYALFLVTDALNSLHGLRLLLLDDLDKLDAEAFKNLLELVLMPEVQDSYDHIFMSLVDHSDALEAIDSRKSELNFISW